MPPPERAVRAAEHPVATPPIQASSDLSHEEDTDAIRMPRANGVAVLAAGQIQSVAAAVPQELAELLDVGKTSPLMSRLMESS